MRSKLKERKPRRNLSPLSTVVFLFLMTSLIVYAEPSTHTLIKIVDQKGRAVNGIVVKAIGGVVRQLNSTHFLVESNTTFVLRVVLYNVTVFQKSLKLGGSFVVKAAIVDMVVKSPSPDLLIEVHLVSSSKSWRFIGKREYIISQAPAGTYRIIVKGSKTVEKILYFTGGTIDISKEYRTSEKAVPTILITLLPACSYTGYRVLKGRRKALKLRYRKRNKKPKRSASYKNKNTKISEQQNMKVKPIAEERRIVVKEVKKRTLAEILEILP